jgi:hypothetical protein
MWLLQIATLSLFSIVPTYENYMIILSEMKRMLELYYFAWSLISFCGQIYQLWYIWAL